MNDARQIIPAEPGTFVISREYWLQRILQAGGNLEIPDYERIPVVGWCVESDGGVTEPVTSGGIAFDGDPCLIIDPRGLVWHDDWCLQNPNVRQWLSREASR